ncbi:MAG: phosphonate C-P lyase system protein PhnG [Ruminococcaceae bacterium]|nr:phosphonate C-P lyase system protein PhnG [Oscillospiraceae bacterium]
MDKKLDNMNEKLDNIDKKQMTKVLVRADRSDVATLSKNIQKSYKPIIVKEPAKALAMIKLRDPVKQGLFYLGEVIVCEAVVEIDGEQGIAVIMGDDADKVLDMAIIDAAVKLGVFDDYQKLKELEKKQNERLMQENAMTLNTMVNFTSMDGEAPDDLAANKKA